MEIWTAVIADEDHMIWLRAPNQPLNGPYGDCFLEFQKSFFKYEKGFFFVFSIHEIEEKHPQGEKHLNNPSNYDIYLN